MTHRDNAVQVFINNKGSRSILYKGFAYRYIRTNLKTGNIVWRCTEKSCCATVTTDPVVSKRLKTNKSAHDHEPANVDVGLKALRWEVKQEARADVAGKPSPRWYLENVQRREQRSIKFEVFALRQVMYREQRRQGSPAEQEQEESPAEVVREIVQRDDLHLDDGRRYVHVTENVTEPMVVATCATNLVFLLHGTDAVFVDVTHAPRATAPFPSAYTVHGVAGSWCVLLAHLFVPVTTVQAGSYVLSKCMWTALDTMCRSLTGGPFAPRLLMLAGLEPVAHATAMITCPPGTEVRAARLHVGRAWAALVQRCPVLEAAYRDPAAEPGHWLRSFFGLPYLPPELVPDGFVALMEDCPGCRPFVIFADHVLDNYIESCDEGGGGGGGGGFVPDQWAQRPGDSDEVNAVISYFGRPDRRFRVPLPNVICSLDVLRQKQKVTDSALRLIKRSADDNACSREIHNDTKFVTQTFRSLIENEINLKTYLRIVGTKFTQLD